MSNLSKNGEAFVFHPERLTTGAPSLLTEASAEELRVLLTLISAAEGEDADTLAARAGVSRARLASALTFWEQLDVLTPSGEADDRPCPPLVAPVVAADDAPAERLTAGALYPEPARKTADTIRDRNLASLLEELAALQGRPDLAPEENKRIVSLLSQYALTEEYVLTLAAHLADGGRLTVVRLIDTAIRLVGRGIDTAEALDRYLVDAEKQSGELFEIRRLFGIYNRNLSKSEVAYFTKWTQEYAYSLGVIGEAYDIAVLKTGKAPLKYIDELLTDWHTAGCTTEQACRARYEQVTAQREAERRDKQRHPTPTPREKPRYGDFDPEEALKQALARSFSEEDAP